MGAPMPANHFGGKGWAAIATPKMRLSGLRTNRIFVVANLSHYP